MKRLLAIFVILISTLTADAAGIVYKLYWEKNRIRVCVEMETSARSVHFDYGNERWGGITQQMKWLQELHAVSGKMKIDSLHHSFMVKPQKGKISFSYVVRRRMPDSVNNNTCIWDMFAPDIDTAMLYVQSFNLFAKPKLDADIPVTIKWMSVPNYPVFCLYNPGMGTEPFVGMLSDVEQSVIVGDPMLEVTQVTITGKVNYLVTAVCTNKDKNKQDLVQFMSRAYGNYADFWDDKMDEPYSLIVFPFRNNKFTVSGNGYKNGFLSRYDATCDTILTQERRNVFVHEIGHKWINNGPDWFAEGFNELQTAYQLVASGLDSADYFCTYLNEALKGLYNNKHRNESDSMAAAHFWDDGDYIWLLYWRGFSYAFFLAGEIEHQTGRKDFFYEMMNVLKYDLANMTEEKFLSDMGKLIDEKFLNQSFNDYIRSGKDIDYSKAHLPSGCKVYYLPSGEPQIIATERFAEHFKKTYDMPVNLR